jgi:hypothetical protein
MTVRQSDALPAALFNVALNMVLEGIVEKCMKMSSTQARRYLQNIIIGDFNFEGVESFTHLGSVIDNRNKMWNDIHSIIMTANHAYSAHIKLFRSKLLSRNTKLEIYKTLI